MFEGTDLSMAYGINYDAPAAPLPAAVPKPALMSNPPPPPAVENQKSAVSHALPPDVGYAPPAAMFAAQSPTAVPAGYGGSGESFWDRIGSKKWEVLKMVLFSMVVLLALAVDHMASHYLNNYIGSSFLSATQEMLVRASYPVAILVLIWIVKAL